MLKSMREAHFRTPPLNQFRYHVKYITTSPQGVDVQNLVGIESAVTDLRMREKKQFCVDFLLTYLSIYLSVYPFLSVFHRISNDRITRQPLTFSQKMVLKIWKTQLRKHLLNTEMT